MNAIAPSEETPGRPGMLIVHYGDEVVTLDPSAPLEKFCADRERMNALLMKMDRDFSERRRT